MLRKITFSSIAAVMLLFSSCKKDKLPTACFDTDTTTPQNAESIAFTSCSTGGETYAWDFGDGNTASTPNATHAYNAAGTYTVKLTVTNPAGSNTQTKTITVVNGPVLRFKFVFDSTLPRLNNLGQPATVPSGHAAQSPKFNQMGAHYIELAPTMYTALGTGEVLYIGEETTQGGERALMFDKQKLVSNNEEFFAIAMKDVAPGTYEWLRVSLAYQNYTIDYRFNGNMYTGTLASFIGYNTYIGSYKIKNTTKTVNSNKKQGYWGFEETLSGYALDGQAPAGATTVPNPLFATAPIPSGSCVVTGSFPSALTVTGNETQDKTIIVKVSINKSFEWIDNGNDGIFDSPTDAVVDMGVRGIYPEVQ